MSLLAALLGTWVGGCAPDTSVSFEPLSADSAGDQAGTSSLSSPITELPAGAAPAGAGAAGAGAAAASSGGLGGTGVAGLPNLPGGAAGSDGQPTPVSIDGSGTCGESTCNVACQGGGCRLRCLENAHCSFVCPGGGCTFSCKGKGPCNVDCGGHDDCKRAD